jgi:hypothetical protein
MSLSDASTYISTFDRSQFGITLAAFLLPAVVLGAFLQYALHWSWFRVELFATFWARFKWQCVRHPLKFERSLPWLMALVWFVLVGALVMFIVFAAMVRRLPSGSHFCSFLKS